MNILDLKISLTAYLGYRQYDKDKLIQALEIQKNQITRMQCDRSITKLTKSLINLQKSSVNLLV